MQGYLTSPSFNLVQPQTARVPSMRYPLDRPVGGAPELLGLPGHPVDVFNTSVPGQPPAVTRDLERLCRIPRMSTFAIASLINQAVAGMPPGAAYVNVGLYAGFSLFAGMVQNPDRPCVGIDNFSVRSARAGLERRFGELGSPAHRFCEMDYRDYFADVHGGPIGVYMYDGDHAYEHQLQGLQVAEPFFADGCIVFVDDTNWEAAREATIDFVSSSPREYEILMDRTTRDLLHPTFWNGLMGLRATGRSRSRSPADVRAAFERRPYAPTRPAVNTEPRTPRGDGDRAGGALTVSLVLVNDDPRANALARSIEAAQAQTWPRVELLVLNRSGSAGARAVTGGYQDVTYLEASAQGPGAGLRDAVASTAGDLVALADAAEPLPRTAIEVGIGFPGTPFFRAQGKTRYADYERAVLGA